MRSGTVLNALSADRLNGDECFWEHADRGAVLRRNGIEIIGHLDAARSDHVLHHERRVAGNMRLHEPREQPRLKIIAAADVDADIHVDRLAPVEIGDGIGAGRESGQRQLRDEKPRCSCSDYGPI